MFLFSTNYLQLELSVVFRIIVFVFNISHFECVKVFHRAHTEWHSSDDEPQFLITGGYRPQYNDLIKYVVSIRAENDFRFFGDTHFCAGSILKPDLIITAEHCVISQFGDVKLPTPIIVVAGTPNRIKKVDSSQIFKAAKYKFLYEKDGVQPDVALIKLDGKIEIDGTFTDLIPIATKPPSDGMKCYLTGWGRLFQNGPLTAKPLTVDVMMWSEIQCKRYYNAYDPSLLCASDVDDTEKDACQGDSGGPLICDKTLYGVVSFGYGCGNPFSPGFYVNVYKYRQWILSEGEVFDNNLAQFQCELRTSLLLLSIIALIFKSAWH